MVVLTIWGGGGSGLLACTDEAEAELASSFTFSTTKWSITKSHSSLSFSNHKPPFPFLHHPSIPCLPTTATSTSLPGFYAVGGVNFPTDRIPGLLCAADPTVALLQLLPSPPSPQLSEPSASLSLRPKHLLDILPWSSIRRRNETPGLATSVLICASLAFTRPFPSHVLPPRAGSNGRIDRVRLAFSLIL